MGNSISSLTAKNPKRNENAFDGPPLGPWNSFAASSHNPNPEPREEEDASSRNDVVPTETTAHEETATSSPAIAHAETATAELAPTTISSHKTELILATKFLVQDPKESVSDDSSIDGETYTAPSSPLRGQSARGQQTFSTRNRRSKVKKSRKRKKRAVRADMICGECDQRGHTRWTCPQLPCRTCGELGHLSPGCPRRRARKLERQRGYDRANRERKCARREMDDEYF